MFSTTKTLVLCWFFIDELVLRVATGFEYLGLFHTGLFSYRSVTMKYATMKCPPLSMKAFKITGVKTSVGDFFALRIMIISF